jgi:hypothetical protein
MLGRSYLASRRIERIGRFSTTFKRGGGRLRRLKQKIEQILYTDRSN